MRRLLLIALLIAMPLSLTAQRMGFTHFSGHSPGPRASGFSRTGYRRAAYAVPFFDPLYSDYATGYAEPSQPPVIVLQAPPAAAEPVHPPTQPLMIELRGDRYVQISGDEVSQSQMIDRMPATQPASGSITSSTKLDAKIGRAFTVLVFRDGHREEISEYTIADGVLYASADYYASGSWNHKIALSSLNLPETITANHSRDVQFHVPTSPNEVIVGP